MPEFLLNKITGSCTLIKKKTLAQVFCCEFCKFFKNTYFYRTPPMANSESEYFGSAS